MTDRLPESASQTAGPYVHIGCTPNFAGITGLYGEDLGARMILGDVAGDRIRLQGRILDGAGAPLGDALIEAWQADASGRFAGQADADPQFAGFGRCACDAQSGAFAFDTVKPGPVERTDGAQQAPHVTLWIVARGINLGLQTRAYFSDEEANAADPVLAQLSPARRETLIASAGAEGVYTLDIHLQGPAETVFFSI